LFSFFFINTPRSAAAVLTDSCCSARVGGFLSHNVYHCAKKIRQNLYEKLQLRSTDSSLYSGGYGYKNKDKMNKAITS